MIITVKLSDGEVLEYDCEVVEIQAGGRALSVEPNAYVLRITDPTDDEEDE